MKHTILVRFLPLTLALPMTLAGCGTMLVGDGLLSPKKLARIEVGVTDQMQVRKWFGAPDATEAGELGGAKWTYERSKNVGWSTRGGQVVDVIVDTFVVLIPPTQPRAEDNIHETLVVEFTPTGAVKTFAHDRYRGKRPR